MIFILVTFRINDQVVFNLIFLTLLLIWHLKLSPPRPRLNKKITFIYFSSHQMISWGYYEQLNYVETVNTWTISQVLSIFYKISSERRGTPHINYFCLFSMFYSSSLRPISRMNYNPPLRNIDVSNIDIYLLV